MILLRVFMAVILALAVLYLGAATAADGVERSTDEKGTIHIGVKPPAKQEKAGAMGLPFDPITGQGTPTGTVPPTSRRGRGGPDESVRQKAFEQAHPDMAESMREAETRKQQATEASSAQPEQPPPSEAPAAQPEPESQ